VAAIVTTPFSLHGVTDLADFVDARSKPTDTIVHQRLHRRDAAVLLQMAKDRLGLRGEAKIVSGRRLRCRLQMRGKEIIAGLGSIAWPYTPNPSCPRPLAATAKLYGIDGDRMAFGISLCRCHVGSVDRLLGSNHFVKRLETQKLEQLEARMDEIADRVARNRTNAARGADQHP
jgi:hypothetical protein